MTIYGVDIHPNYQAGISIEQIAREGFDWLAVKASQGTGTSWAPGANAWLDRGDAAGMVTFPYHYLTTAPVGQQASAAKSAARGRPLMLDVETGSGGIDVVRGFLAACRAINQPVPLLYLPRWYWDRIGRPDLSGLPPLVASHYSRASGYASTIYAGVPASWWEPYGGGEVAVLQFTDHASVAGQRIDANAYRGTKDEFRELVYDDVPAAPARPTLREGDVSALVWSVQLFLNRVFPAYSDIDAGPGPTSRFGPQTLRVITEFQDRAGLAADGVIGPATWAALERFGFR